jgi:hypothetical protein
MIAAKSLNQGAADIKVTPGLKESHWGKLRNRTNPTAGDALPILTTRIEMAGPAIPVDSF